MEVDEREAGPPASTSFAMAASSPASIPELDFIGDGDIPFEEEILTRPTVPSFTRYLAHHLDSPLPHRFWLYERAVKAFPGSYKLWYAYLDLRTKHIARSIKTWDRETCQREWQLCNDAFERSLTILHKMPRLWINYCQFLTTQPIVTKVRRTFDAALLALPVTQHARIWTVYIEYLSKTCPNIETSVRCWRRFARAFPDQTEAYIEELLRWKRHDEAVGQLIGLLNEPNYTSPKGNSSYQLWIQLCDIVCKYPQEIWCVDVETVIRDGLQKFKDHIGRLWCALARFHIRKGAFERARDVYEEGMLHVLTVRDFTQIFDAYAEFEESILSARMEEAAGGEAMPSASDEDEAALVSDIDLRLARFEHLMDRRPYLVNDVLLRSNAQNVGEWTKRIALHPDDKAKQEAIYEDAVRQILPAKAQGDLHQFWVDFALFFEKADEIEKARAVFERAIHVPFRRLSDLATVWIQWAEMELRIDNVDGALHVLRRALAPPARPHSIKVNANLPVQVRIFKCVPLWLFYLELEEALGTTTSCQAAYDTCLSIKAATPQICLNYATYLESNDYFEEAFKVYERGIDLFGYPIAYEIWNVYLQKFVQRYEGRKVERARDLFEQAVHQCPEKVAKALYLSYAAFEEQFGLIRHALNVYHRATKAVPMDQKRDIFVMYIQRTTEHLGLTSCREIYELALEQLADKDAREMGMDYAELERKLGEIDRARAVYAYTSQFCDPRSVPDFWKKWHQFEVKHGNEDTFKEMLRIKRSVQAQYNTESSYISAQILSAQKAVDAGATPDNISAGAAQHAMANLEAAAMGLDPAEQAVASNNRIVGFVSGGVAQDGKFVSSNAASATALSGAPTTTAAAAANPDEIQINDDDDDSDEDEEIIGQGRPTQNGEHDGEEDDDDDEEEEDEEMDEDGAPTKKITTKAVPSAVFGGVDQTASTETDAPLGARERFKRKRAQ